jgi:hypothetical protein
VRQAFGGYRWPIAVAAALFALAAGALWWKSRQFAGYSFNMYACLLAMAYVVLRFFLRPKLWTERATLTLALAVLFVGTLAHNNYRSIQMMYSRVSIRTWNIYHYYLGSKYFDELSYTGLYPMTIVADREMKNRLAQVRAIRDMTDYDVKPVDEIVPETHDPAFTEERWEEFKRDVEVFLPKAPGRQWPNILVDRGYNPTPFWNTVGSVVSHALDVAKRDELLLATSIDLALYAIMVIGAWWAFGGEAAMLAFLCFALLPFNVPRLIGGYIQYDWTAAVFLGACFLHRRMPIASALSFAYAVMARVFPLLLVAGLVAPAVRQLVTRRRLDRFYWKFGIAFALACVVGLGVGSMSAKGPRGWLEWQEKIGTHNYEMIFGEGRVGLQHIFTHEFGDEEQFERGTGARKRTYERQAAAYYVAAVAFLALYLGAIWRRAKLNGVLVSMMLVYILFVPSHYYWSILALLPFWRVRADGPWQPALVPALTAFFVPAGWYHYAHDHTFQYAQYIRFDWLLGGCWLVLALYLVFVNLRDTGWLARIHPRLAALAGRSPTG